MPQAAQGARPVVGAAAGFHADDCGRQVGEKFEQFAAAQSLLQRYLAMRVHAMHTEYVLGQVNSCGSNIHDGPPPLSIDRNLTLQSGTYDAVGGGGVYFIR